jgi:hypothetical protein
VDEHLAGVVLEGCAGRHFRGRVTDQRSQAIIFRSGGVCFSGRF